MAQQQISADVEIFLRRALPHFMSGKSVEESMRAVLDDDARLTNAFFTRGHTHYFPTPDERGGSRAMPDRIGDVMANELSRTVHASLTIVPTPA